MGWAIHTEMKLKLHLVYLIPLEPQNLWARIHLRNRSDGLLGNDAVDYSDHDWARCHWQVESR